MTRIKNKRLLIMLIALTLILCCSCGNSQTASKSDVEFLTKPNYWYFYDGVTGEYEKMNFHDDFSYYWGCSCGEPIGDSDLYEFFDYDKENQKIKLYNKYDDSSKEIEVISYSDYHLLLKIDGIIKGYTPEDTEIYIENCEKYFKDYNIYGQIIEGDSEKLILGPFNYDGDVDYPENAFNEYKLSNNVKFYDLQIKKTIKNEEEIIDVNYKELNKEKGIKLLNSNYGFIWFDNSMNVKKVVYYGEIINEE